MATTRTTNLSENDPALVQRMTSLVENYPYFRGSAGRVPSPLWVKDAIKRFKRRAKDESQLAALILDDRSEMIARVGGQNRAGSAFDMKLGTTVEEVAVNAVAQAKLLKKSIYVHHYDRQYYGDTFPMETSLARVRPSDTKASVLQRLGGRRNYTLTNVSGHVVARAHSKVTAHRSARRAKHLGASVNRTKGESKGMSVVLAAVGNPDFDQYGDIGVPRTIASVSSFAEASEVARSFIRKYNLGGGNWSGGQIFCDGKQIAHVSYNGAVWKGRAGSQVRSR